MNDLFGSGTGKTAANGTAGQSTAGKGTAGKDAAGRGPAGKGIAGKGTAGLDFGPGTGRTAGKPAAQSAAPQAGRPDSDRRARPHPPASDAADYSAKDIEVLEGLEPVRRRPGMYIGGTDENALHHLAAEILDNAMDEAVAGHASFIEVTLEADNWLTVRDNGRGIPVDPHPKF